MTKQTVDKALRAYLKARAKAGQSKYGVELQAFNGRKPAYDRLEELLDAAVYSMQDIMERERIADLLERAIIPLTIFENDYPQEFAAYVDEVRDKEGATSADEVYQMMVALRKDVGRVEPDSMYSDTFSMPPATNLRGGPIKEHPADKRIREVQVLPLGKISGYTEANGVRTPYQRATPEALQRNASISVWFDGTVKFGEPAAARIVAEQMLEVAADLREDVERGSR